MTDRAVLRDETILRLGGNGDNWHLTWGADDTQVTALCDGAGWREDRETFHNARLWRVVGGPHDARFEDVPGYPALTDDWTAPPPPRARYYGFGTLAVDGQLYQYLSTFNTPMMTGPDTFADDLRFVGAKLIHSPDGGATWRDQDGTTPVRWPAYDERSRDTMVFFEEDQDAFSLLSIVQMGRDYRANADGHVYVYAPNGSTDGTMNELVLFRVPKDRILDRGAYRYYAGAGSNGEAVWAAGIDDRAVVHTFPRGWVNTDIHPYAWHPSITYNEPLGLYLMANWGMGTTPEGLWFGRPSYLGIYTSPTAWGPWTQIHEETAWTPGGDAAARCYQPQIAPKWISPDGTSFWLVWTDFQSTRTEEEAKREQRRLDDDGAGMAARIDSMVATMPYYSFNAQRVDLR